MDPESRIEELVLQYYERMQQEGCSALNGLEQDHPESAIRVRGALDQLRRLHLLDDSDTPSDLGDFRPIRQLGRGGMGVVYLAEQVTLGRLVALKFMRQGLFESELSRARFTREVELISKLDHPGICTVYEAGELDSNPYLSMRYVAGDSLAARLAQLREGTHESGGTGTSSNDMTRMVRMIESVAHALHYAHENGVVHRDVKPANILVDSEDQPVLIDFGLACDGENSGMTRTGELLGTPAYMAPEQIDRKLQEGQEDAGDRRTDVYGLGVTLYECLTLHQPFESDSREQVYKQILTEPLTDPRRFNRRVDKGLFGIIERATEKRPAKRFATAFDFAEELRRWCEFEPLETHPAGVLKRAVQWSRRNPTIASVMLTTSVGLCISLLLLFDSLASHKQLMAVVFLAKASEVGDENPELAAKLAFAGFSMSPRAETFSRLQEYLFQLRRNSILVAEGGALTTALSSPDGRYLFIGGRNTPGRLFLDGQMVLDNLPAHDRLPVAAFSPDNSELAVATGDGKLSRYSLNGPDAVRALPVFDPKQGPCIWALKYRPNGEQLAMQFVLGLKSWCLVLQGTKPVRKLQAEGSASWMALAYLDDGRLLTGGRVWSADLRESTTIQAQDSTNTWFDFVGVHGEQVVLGSSSNLVGTKNPSRVYQLDLQTMACRLLWENRTANDRLLHREFSEDGRWLSLATREGRVILIDLQDSIPSSEPTQWRVVDGRSVSATQFASRGQSLWVGTESGAIHLYTLGGQLLDTYRGHLGGIRALELPTDRCLLSVSSDGQARSWDLKSPYIVPQHVGLGRSDLVRTKDGLVVVSTNGQVLVCDDELKVLAEGRTAAGNLAHARLSSNGVALRVNIFPGPGYTMNLDPPSNLKACPLVAKFGGLRDAPVIMADGKWVIRRSNRQLCLWDPRAPESELELFKAVTCVSPMTDGNRLLLATFLGTVMIYDVAKNDVVWKVNTGLGNILSARFGKTKEAEDTVVIATEQRLARIYDWEGSGFPEDYGPHQNAVMDAVLSPDGRSVITACRDGKIRVFDRDQGKEPLVIRGSPQGVHRILSMEAGRFVASGMGSVQKWWTDMDALRKDIEQAGYITDFTVAERQRYAAILGSR